jgi:hypothetical protein
VKPASVRFYFDADILGVGKLLATLRPDVTYPGDPGAIVNKRVRPACAITTPRTPDTTWIPVVSGQGLLIVTRDSQIRQHQAEIRAVLDNKAQMVALASAEATNLWAQLEVVMTQWRALESLATQPGPFVYTLTRTSMVKVV